MKKRRQIFKQLGWGIWAEMADNSSKTIDDHLFHGILLVKLEHKIYRHLDDLIKKELMECTK